MREPDPGVVRAAARGDVAAFTVLAREAQPHLWRFLRHLTGDAELAADLTQETLLRVHRSLRTFRGRSRFTTWLFRIARNVALDELRARERRPRTVEADERIAPPSAGPASSVEIRAAVATLPLAQREAFVLAEVYGLPYREVGEVLGVPVGTVKSRVFHARRRLVNWFDADEGHDHPEADDG